MHKGAPVDNLPSGEDVATMTEEQEPPPEAPDLVRLGTQLAALTDAVAALEPLRAQVGELARLRSRDADIIDKLHEDNTRLRSGEVAAAMAPLLSGLVRLHDQMTALADGDPQSVAGMLRTQLLQLLDNAAGVAPFEPAPGERFDARRHSGVGRTDTSDPEADGTVSATLRPGFLRLDGTLVRVADVTVYRYVVAAPEPSEDDT